jgi:large subunit ribosomal protein L29
MAKDNSKKKLKDLREKENDQLQQELVAATRHMYDLRSQAVTEKLEDPSQLGKTRRQIAQIRTILRERQLKAVQQTV